MTGLLLPVPEGLVAIFRGLWKRGWYDAEPYPRSVWLGDFEQALRALFPTASSNDLTRTARSLAPFYIERQGEP